jgi:hypothetical protein
MLGGERLFGPAAGQEPARLAVRQGAEDVLRWNFDAGFMLSMPVHKRLFD